MSLSLIDVGSPTIFNLLIKKILMLVQKFKLKNLTCNKVGRLMAQKKSSFLLFLFIIILFSKISFIYMT